ncbi:MAG: amino acid permease [Saprospiraceae bacterium]|nr:amino acid permease [Saprospiraceae bacterium]
MLNTRGLTMIAIGACIGSGIFVTPADTMATLPHHGYVLLTWIIGGLVAFLGALTFSELGATYPKEGGVYVYLKHAYGDMAGFLYGLDHTFDCEYRGFGSARIGTGRFFEIFLTCR